MKNEIFIIYGQVENDSILCLLEVGIGLYGLQIPSSKDNVCFGWAWLKDGQSYSHTEGVRLLDHQAIISNQTRTDVRLKARDYALAGLLKQLHKAFNPDSA